MAESSAESGRTQSIMPLEGDDWVLELLTEHQHPSAAAPKLPASIAATVPGSVHMDLLKAGVIQEPYSEYNELQQRWIMWSDWRYMRCFSVSEEVLSGKKHSTIELVLSGVDCIATVILNAKKLGELDNEFREHSLVVPSDLLRPGHNANVLQVILHSPAKYCLDRNAEFQQKQNYSVPCSEYPNSEKSWNQIRKAGCSFGWDWGPCFGNTGITKPIFLRLSYGVQIGDTIVQTTLTNFSAAPTASATVEVKVQLLFKAPAVEVYRHSLEMTLLSPKGELVKSLKFAYPQETRLINGEIWAIQTFQLDSVDLWYPNGFQHKLRPLYTLKTALKWQDGSIVAEKQRMIGFRSVELNTDPDPAGGNFFFFKVNGSPIFIKGANYIPMDCFPTRVTSADVRRLLDSVVGSNMNCIRIWGGGRYETDKFYDLCDQMGLLLFHDLMFACSLYPADEKFLQNVKAEVAQQVARISSHPSLLVWCANNENEELIFTDWLKLGKDKPKFFLDYYKLTIETVMPVVQTLVPTLPFWPSSPSNGFNDWTDPAAHDKGDMHYWGVWHGGKPLSTYLEIKPRFCSEFGFQSFPTVASLQQAGLITSEQLNVSSPEMDFRQRSPIQGNKAIIEHVSKNFRFPTAKGFESFVWTSQLMQGLAIKTGVEHWRRLRPYCMGTIYWQLNDIWQGPSWSSLEYNGHWKLLHHFAQQFYAPVLLSVFESSQNTLEVWLTDDDLKTPPESCSLQLIDIKTGETVWQQLQSTENPKGQHSLKIASVDLLQALKDLPALATVPKARHRNWIEENLFARVRGGGAGGNVHFFGPIKKLALPTAQIKLDVIANTTTGWKARVKSQGGVALFATLEWKAQRKVSGQFQGNIIFALVPGDTEEVSFTYNTPTASPANDIELIITSLRDTY